MDKVLRFVKNVTVFLFVVALGIAYYEFTDRSGEVTLYVDAEENPMAKISTETFFYTNAVFFIVVNVLVSVIAKMMYQFPFEKTNLIPHPEFWLRDNEMKSKLSSVLVSWIYSFALIINTLMVFLIVKIWMTNRSSGGQLWEYGIIVSVFLLALILWAGFIAYRLRLRKEEFIS